MNAHVFPARSTKTHSGSVSQARHASPVWQRRLRRRIDALDFHHNVVVLQPLQAWGAVPRFTAKLAPLTRVFLGVQYPWFSYDAVRLAVDLAAEHGATLEIVYVIDAFKEIFRHHNEALINNSDAFLADMQRELDATVAKARQQGVACAGCLRVGPPGVELDVSSGETDLVVLNVDKHSVQRILGALGPCRIQWSGWPGT